MSFFKGVFQGMKNFGYNISLLVNSLLLLVVYVIGVGLTSLVAKFSGKNFLEKDLSSESKTYWKELNLEKKSVEECYRQF